MTLRRTRLALQLDTRSSSSKTCGPRSLLHAAGGSSGCCPCRARCAACSCAAARETESRSCALRSDCGRQCKRIAYTGPEDDTVREQGAAFAIQSVQRIMIGILALRVGARARPSLDHAAAPRRGSREGRECRNTDSGKRGGRQGERARAGGADGALVCLRRSGGSGRESNGGRIRSCGVSDEFLRRKGKSEWARRGPGGGCADGSARRGRLTFVLLQHGRDEGRARARRDLAVGHAVDVGDGRVRGRVALRVVVLVGTAEHDDLELAAAARARQAEVVALQRARGDARNGEWRYGARWRGRESSEHQAAERRPR